MSLNNSKLTTSHTSSSKKPPLPSGLSNIYVGKNSSSTLNKYAELLTPNHRSIITQSSNLIEGLNQRQASASSSHSRSPSTSSMIFGTIESGHDSSNSSSILNKNSPSLLNKTKSVDAESSASDLKKAESLITKSDDVKSKLKSTSLSSNLSSHTGSMASKLNQDFPFKFSNSGVFSNKHNNNNNNTIHNPITSPHLGRGRSGSGGSTGGGSASGIIKKKKLSSALTLPSFLSRKRHSIESLIEYSNSFVSLTLQRHLSSSNKSTEQAHQQQQQQQQPSLQVNDEEISNEQINTLKNLTNQLSNDYTNECGSKLIDNSQHNEQMDDCEHDVNENIENNFVYNAYISSPNSIRKSELVNTDQMSDHANRKLNSDELSLHQQAILNDERHPNKSSNRRAIKKTRSSTNPTSKSFQTKSMSNIRTSTLNHSNSDNELDNRNHFIDPDDQNLIDYRDDVPYTSDDNLDESSIEKLEVNGFSDYNQLINKPINLSILLNYILNSQSENPKNLYFCIFVDELLNSYDKKEIFKWAYELYSTFFMADAPLKIKINEMLCKKVEELLDKNAFENTNSLKKLFEDAKLEAVEIVNLQLTKFRNVKQIGLANLFNGNDLLKLSQTYKSDFDTIRTTLADSFNLYLSDIGKEILRVSSDWNDVPRNQEALISAQICSFATFVKKFNIPIKYIGKLELDKIPLFVNKKSKIKKFSSSNRGHNFVEYQFQSSKSLCSKCNQPFWGIGSQGVICQKSKCEMKMHRSCLNTGAPSECHSSQKTIRTDYKEKFQSILFGSKKKDEEPIDSNYSTVASKTQFYSTQNSTSSIHPQTSSNNSSMNGSFDILNNRNDFDRQASIINGDPNQSSKFSTDYDQTRNLPVELAIKKFEMLNAKKSTPPLVASPSGNGPMLQRTSTINGGSGSGSPTTNNPSIFRHNSMANVANNQQNDNFNNSQINYSLKKDLKSNNSSQLLPNKQYSNSHLNSSNENKNTSKEQTCKRVSSLKEDVKKVKTNVTRSKSDPEPEEIKTAINSSQASNYNEKYLMDSTLVEDSFQDSYSTNTNSSNLNSSNHQPINTTFSNRITPSPSILSSNTLSHQNSSVFGFPSSASTSTLQSNNNNNQTRHPWMNNDSDMEVDEELPSLTTNVDKETLQKLDKKQMKIQEVINELIHTEQKHVRNLKIMKYHFYLPIKIEMYLTDEERNLLFPNLDEILELHSAFNQKLKDLRKENPIVPLKELIDIILNQFEGQTGHKFKIACATFCQNQGEAMKLLQNKMKHDKFTSFLGRAENDQVCRKLHLKDFIPTEVQRLVKYRLLFQELTKNANDDDKAKLIQCMDASSNISQYVNKAVTECENRKRCKEIQNRMDTREFDQYCVKSPLLAQYKNLDLRKRKLIYEGELEWSSNGSIKLMVFLFEDILVFLEKERPNEEKRRYVLRPLLYTITKKMTFTPVVPLQCINSFSPSHEKRNFHIVVIMDKSQSKSIEPQMLFMFTAKSGDERNKWIHHLQELTGKMSQNDKTLNTSVDLTSPTVGLYNASANQLSYPQNYASKIQPNISAPNLMVGIDSKLTSVVNNVEINNKQNESNESIKKDLKSQTLQMSSNSINLDQPDYSIVDESLLKNLLDQNTQQIIDLLKSRQKLLAQMFRIDSQSAASDVCKDLSTETINQQNNSQHLINHSFNLMNIMTNIIVNDDSKAPNQNRINKNEPKLIEILSKLEYNLNKLQQNINVDIMDNQITRLPNLNLNFNSNINDYETNYEEDENERRSNKRHQSAPTNESRAKSSSFSKSRSKLDKRSSRFLEKFNDNDLQQTSISSSISTNADLSEDEQINYYNDDDEINDSAIKQNIDSPARNLVNSPVKIESSTNNRRSSNSSDRTLIVMPTESIITENVILNKNHSAFESHNLENPQIRNDKHFNQYDVDKIKERESSDDENSSEASDDNVSEPDDSENDEVIENDKMDDNDRDSKIELISVKIKPKSFDGKDGGEEDDASQANDERPPSLPKNDPPPINHELNNQSNTNNNDLSDDEVKEYHIFKDNFDSYA